jgi:hypothetical protein
VSAVPEHPIVARVRERRARHKRRSRAFRVAFALGGFGLVGVGAALLVLPGPGIPVVLAGLFMLALEFAWAERLLARTVMHAERARAASARGKAVAAVAGIVATAVVLAAVLVWDVPLLPG